MTSSTGAVHGPKKRTAAVPQRRTGACRGRSPKATAAAGPGHLNGQCEYQDRRGHCRRAATHEIVGWFHHEVCWPHAVILQNLSRVAFQIRELP